jgi:hypothetical protein
MTARAAANVDPMARMAKSMLTDHTSRPFTSGKGVSPDICFAVVELRMPTQAESPDVACETSSVLLLTTRPSNKLVRIAISANVAVGRSAAIHARRRRDRAPVSIWIDDDTHRNQ